jgi:hypothetical protein
MGALSTQLRCIDCGTPIPGPDEAACPDCQADLSEVGIWSELLEWGHVRQMGKTRFILRHGILLHGGLTALALLLGMYFFKRQGDLPLYLITVFLWVIGGYFVALWHWRSAEKQYLTVAHAGRVNHPSFRRPPQGAF